MWDGPDSDIYFPNRIDLAALAPKTGLFVQIGCPVRTFSTQLELRCVSEHYREDQPFEGCFQHCP
jgi:hypothetical protein